MESFNLADDLQNNQSICEKTIAFNWYAKDLYRALCNNQWRKREVMPLLRDERWGCSWRFAGGIVADIRQEGDYMDWYCSGSEGTVTKEIEKDLLAAGWELVK